MKKKRMVEVEQEYLCCDSCGEEIKEKSNNLYYDPVELNFKHTDGYSLGGTRFDDEWNYVLCKTCALCLKSFLDGGHNLQKIEEMRIEEADK